MRETGGVWGVGQQTGVRGGVEAAENQRILANWDKIC